MPQINLSNLSGQELRQRLDSSRARGDATLAYEILREMAARRAKEGGRRPLLKRRAAEPRVVDIDLGDPLDKDDELPPMPHWRAPGLVDPGPQPAAGESAAAEPAAASPPRGEPPPAPKPSRKRHPIVAIAGPVAAEPQPTVARPTDPEALPHFRPLDAPLTLGDPEPAAWAAAPDGEPADLRLDVDAPPPPAPRPRAGHAMRVVAGFAVGITSGVALGWFAAGLAQDGRPPAAPVQVASAQAPPAPALLEVVAEPAPPPLEMDVAEAAEAADTATPAAAAEFELPAAEPPPPVDTAERPAAELQPAALAANGCAAEPTPADREICADPALQRLQRDLRRAYAEALDAHQDRALLRQRQLAWRDARSDVTDPNRLARLYEQRIRRLQAAAAEARGLR